MKFNRSGPWDKEPDRLEYEHACLPCVIIRAHTTGNLNGYVGIPFGHPLFGKEYEKVDLEVHGGVTYGEQGLPTGERQDLWWFGFDTSHFGDYSPSFGKEPHELEVYREMEYVISQTNKLADQLSLIGASKVGHRG